MNSTIENSIKLVKTEYLKSDRPWYIGFSGGKDSSAVLIITLLALQKLKSFPKPLNIIYCDTGVEIPIVYDHTIRVIKNLSIEIKNNNYPINIYTPKPDIQDKYFVKLIGRGYPPPTNKFLWCTKRLRLNPIKKVIHNSRIKENIMLLGTRNGESLQRNKTLKNHETSKEYYYTQSNFKNQTIFSPIVNFSTNDVWNTITNNYFPNIINPEVLLNLYKASKNTTQTSISRNHEEYLNNRFGCWTCTVVRKDRSVKSLISKGYTRLIPLLAFRDWLYTIRDMPRYRCSVRRNGQHGPGPFTLDARKLILEKLLIAQYKSNYSLISDEELTVIHQQWENDKKSNYLNTCENSQ